MHPLTQSQQCPIQFDFELNTSVHTYCIDDTCLMFGDRIIVEQPRSDPSQAPQAPQPKKIGCRHRSNDIEVVKRYSEGKVLQNISVSDRECFILPHYRGPNK